MPDADHIAALVLLALAVFMMLAGISSAIRRDREISAAKLRHPSVRTAPATPSVTTDADAAERERRYHSSNQFGR